MFRPAARGIAPSLPQPGQREWLVVRVADEVGLLPLAGFLPFEKAVDWNEAPPLPHGRAESRLTAAVSKRALINWLPIEGPSPNWARGPSGS